jgi:hypothetical protein
MDLSTFDGAAQLSQESLTIDALSIYKAFEQVKDRRGKKGKRYPLAFILTLITLGKLAGETKLDGIIDWINNRRKELKCLLNWPTYINTLAKCDHQEVVNALTHMILKVKTLEECDAKYSKWIEEQGKKGKNLVHTAMDGKVMRGTMKHAKENQPPVWLLPFMNVEVV